VNGRWHTWAGPACALLVALAADAAFCAASRQNGKGPPQMTVALMPDGTFTVGGKAAKLAKLPARLKAAGATGQTVIVVAIGDDTPQATLAAIAGKLRAEGLARMVFVRPRRADAWSDADRPGGCPRKQR
jgi:biopolymer transport protein ExbD